MRMKRLLLTGAILAGVAGSALIVGHLPWFRYLVVGGGVLLIAFLWGMVIYSDVKQYLLPD